MIDYPLLLIGLVLHALAWYLITHAVVGMLDETTEGDECWLIKRLRTKIVIYHLRLSTLSQYPVNSAQCNLIKAKLQFCDSLFNYLTFIGFKTL